MLLITIISFGLLTIVHGQCALKTIAFTAALSQSQTIPADKVIVYDTTITNNGLAYDNKTGIFKSPTEGLYLFHLHVLNTIKHEAWLELLLNDKLVVSVYAQNSSLYDSAGNSVILNLEPGDRVYIKTRRESGLYGLPIELYNTFSGHFLGAKS